MYIGQLDPLNIASTVPYRSNNTAGSPEIFFLKRLKGHNKKYELFTQPPNFPDDNLDSISGRLAQSTATTPHKRRVQKINVLLIVRCLSSPWLVSWCHEQDLLNNKEDVGLIGV